MRPTRLCSTLAALALAVASPAQVWMDAPRPARIAEPPPTSDSVTALLNAAYLRDDEAKDLRIFHGLWTAADLDTPARRARAALLDARFDDASLGSPDADDTDRAAALLALGRPADAQALLREEGSARARRLRAEAHEAMGERDRAIAEAEVLASDLVAGKLQAPADAVEGVAALRLLARLKPQQQPAGGDYRHMMSSLGLARERGGRLDWRIPLAEAEILFEKHNRAEAAQAVTRALALNPRLVRAWALVGRAAAEGFDFANAEAIARRIDTIAGAPSLASVGVLVRARLKQNDPDGADEALAPLAESAVAEAISLRACIAAARYDLDAVEALLARHDAVAPGSAAALLEVGRTLSDARQYEMAAAFLRRAAERAPFQAEPVAELGLMGLQSGDDQQAIDNLARAAALDPFDLRVENSLKLARELQTYARLETPHFIVRFKPGVDQALADLMPDALEGMHRRVTGPDGIDHEPARRTVIDLMPDHRWFSVRIAGVTQIHTMAASTGPTIAMETPREGPGHSIGAYDWLRVVRHEYTHTVTLSRTRNRIPHWFTEAAAVYMEDSPRDITTCRLLESALDAGQLFDLTAINVAFVRPRRPTDRSLAYAQGHWMYEYIVRRWGGRAPLDLMDRYAAGDREQQAFPAVLGISTDQFLADFKVWAREQLVAWGLGQRPGEPTIAQILLAESAADDPDALAHDLASFVDEVGTSAAAGAAANREWDHDVPAPSEAMALRWLERFPKHPDLLEAAVKYALEAAGQKATAELVPLLRRYADARPVDPLPHQKLAQLGMANPETMDPIQHLRYLDAREQNSPVYAAELARRAAAAGDWTSALASAARAVTVSPYDPPMRELAARIAIQARDLAVARRHLVALTLIEPSQAKRHRQRLDALDRMIQGK
ncbi:MAG: hypothetical protein JNM80_05045 [Phycisphaerae bacterium]|nr:hypothetical protein [Phycisphaerae bacterium]